MCVCVCVCDHFKAQTQQSLDGLSRCMHAKLLQSYPTLCDPVNHGSPGSSVHGISQPSGLPCLLCL